MEHHAADGGDDRVEWALREIEQAVTGSSCEPQARIALDVLRRAITQARTRATTDPLTGLANRAWFYQVLDRCIGSCATVCNSAAVLFLDLDGFKQVNDERGHPVGDVLLADVATRISRSVREHDLVARHGGDEFVVLLENIENASIAHAVAARVIEAISVPFTVDGKEVRLGVSIGVAFYPEHGVSSADLLKRADHAMYRAKNQGGRSYAVYGEREELSTPRSPMRSWAWELSVAVDGPANDIVLKPARERKA